MKRMRLTAMLLAVALAFTTFSGCGAKSTETGDDSEWVVVGDNDTETEVESTEAEEPTEADTEAQEVKAAGKSAEGGTLQPLLENDEAAELTRARVYELAEILKGE